MYVIKKLVTVTGMLGTMLEMSADAQTLIFFLFLNISVLDFAHGLIPSIQTELCNMHTRTRVRQRPFALIEL
jgi:hypothetical protein